MFGKTPVTALQEYCAKKNIKKPEYEFKEASDGSKSFICIVQSLGEMAEGVGRSKREAKHDASASLIKKLKRTHPDIEEIPQAPHEAIPTSDAVADLRDVCIQEDHPLPFFDIVQQAGPPEAPEFTAVCKVASITRYATASTKKGAKQLAAQEIIRIIKNINASSVLNWEVANLDNQILEEETRNKKKIKTYREYIESDIKVIPGTKLCDRHTYYVKMPSDVKKKVRDILESTMIVSNREKVDLILKELEIKYKIGAQPGINTPIMTLELICDYDAFFAGSEDDLFQSVLNYFNVMLY